MTAKIITLPLFYHGGPTDPGERRRLAVKYLGKTRDDMRALWDSWDCDDPKWLAVDPFWELNDISAYMNMIGDGAYCAV